MNQGGTPAATREPIIDPAEVPTMYSALPGSQRVAWAMAYMPPVNQAPPRTPPAPSTSPTRLGSACVRSDAVVLMSNSYPRMRFLHLAWAALGLADRRNGSALQLAERAGRAVGERMKAHRCDPARRVQYQLSFGLHLVPKGKHQWGRVAHSIVEFVVD